MINVYIAWYSTWIWIFLCVFEKKKIRSILNKCKKKLLSLKICLQERLTFPHRKYFVQKYLIQKWVGHLEYWHSQSFNKLFLRGWKMPYECCLNKFKMILILWSTFSSVKTEVEFWLSFPKVFFCNQSYIGCYLILRGSILKKYEENTWYHQPFKKIFKLVKLKRVAKFCFQPVQTLKIRSFSQKILSEQNCSKIVCNRHDAQTIGALPSNLFILAPNVPLEFF